MAIRGEQVCGRAALHSLNELTVHIAVHITVHIADSWHNVQRLLFIRGRDKQSDMESHGPKDWLICCFCSYSKRMEEEKRKSYQILES